DVGRGGGRGGVGRGGGHMRLEGRRVRAPGGPGARPHPETAGHLIQPRPDRRPPGYRTRLAGQEQEGGLENVLFVAASPEHAPGGPADQPAVPTDQLGERRLVPGGGERGQQLGVGPEQQTVTRAPKGGLERGAQRGGRHGPLPKQRPYPDDDAFTSIIMPRRPASGTENHPTRGRDQPAGGAAVGDPRARRSSQRSGSQSSTCSGV